MDVRGPGLAAMLLAAAGCADDGTREVSARLAAIEQRLAVLEERHAETASLARALDTLARDVDVLETQVAAVPAARAPQVVVPEPGTHAPVPAPHADHAPLAEAYRERVAEIQARYADDPASPARLRELAELKRSFYESLAELRETGRTDPVLAPAPE